MCYWGEANSIQLCDECSVNSRMLSINCWYLKENLHTTPICRVDSLPQPMPNSVRMYYTFCLASRPHTSFAFAFSCKYDLRPMTRWKNEIKKEVYLTSVKFIIYHLFYSVCVLLRKLSMWIGNLVFIERLFKTLLPSFSSPLLYSFVDAMLQIKSRGKFKI